MYTEDFDPPTLGDIARKHAALRGDRVASIFEGRETTFAAFDRHTDQVANALIAAGVPPQTHIAYLGKNSDLYFELLYGAAKARVILAPVNWRLAPPEIAYIVDDCKASMLFVGPEFVDTVKAIAAELKTVTTIVAMEAPVEGWPLFTDWRDAQPATSPARTPTVDDVAIQLYTSGTTGHPKGAMLAHRNLCRPRIEEPGKPRAWSKWTADDVSLVAMPVFHIGGSGAQIGAMRYGAKCIIRREFKPDTVLDDFEQHGISRLFLVPAAMQFIIRLPRARTTDYSKLKFINYGASPIPVALLRECMDVFKCGFVQMYGMTETTGTIIALEPEDHTVEDVPHMRSAGKALPGVEIAILDAAGNRLKTGEVGEIATRSAANMVGYWNLPEATARTVDGEGWLRTGDAGYVDENGFVYVHDRVKDMIISGAENIYPAEVENAIYGHPAVGEVAVIGVPDDTWGESVKAVVALKPGQTATAEEIIAFARTRIAGYKSPRSVDFVPELPRNPSGKLLKRVLREPYWSGKTRRVN